MDASVKHLIAQVKSKTGEQMAEGSKMVYIIDSDHVIEHGENDGANSSSNH